MAMSRFRHFIGNAGDPHMQAMVTVSKPKVEPLPAWIERVIRLPAGVETK
jgi:hypothetical protein